MTISVPISGKTGQNHEFAPAHECKNAQLQKAYVDTCHALETYADKEKLHADNSDWLLSHDRTYNLLRAMFPSLYAHEEAHGSPEEQEK